VLNTWDHHSQTRLLFLHVCLSNDTFLAVVIGRLNTPKGHIDLIQALHKIQNKIGDAIVAFIDGCE